MGMFDIVVFEMEMPEFQGRRFQTKNLDCCMDRFAITKTGRLCLTGNELMEDVVKPETERVDIDYHGDLRLISEKEQEAYTARFTHGTLEWIRPADRAAAVDMALKKSRCRTQNEPVRDTQTGADLIAALQECPHPEIEIIHKLAVSTSPIDWTQCPAVESVPGKVSGAWVLKDTRMPVSAIFKNLEAGASIDEIMEWFNGLDRAQVQEVIAFVTRSLDKAPTYAP
jgi:uncharacterized protein (DUF433 family)